jgi:hypothetical protein
MHVEKQSDIFRQLNLVLLSISAIAALLLKLERKNRNKDRKELS